MEPENEIRDLAIRTLLEAIALLPDNPDPDAVAALKYSARMILCELDPDWSPDPGEDV